MGLTFLLLESMLSIGSTSHDGTHETLPSMHMHTYKYTGWNDYHVIHKI